MVPPLDNPAARVPVRTCIGCREKAARSELLRLVAGTSADGRPTVVPDPAGAAPGRGAHLHPTKECFELAERRRAFARALRHDAGGRGPLELDVLRQYLAPDAPTPYVTDQSR